MGKRQPIRSSKGSRNNTTLAIQALLDGETEEITQRIIGLAKIGDRASQHMILKRILPPRKDNPVTGNGILQ